MSPGAKSYAAAAAGGALLWGLTSAVTGRAEAWDSSLYWTIAYPLSILLAAGVGYWLPDRAWRFGLVVVLVQAVVLAFATSDFGMLPLGMILFGFLSLPAVGAATLAARIRRRRMP